MRDYEGLYTTEERTTIAEAPGLRVRRLALGAGQSVPWHLHTMITDTFVCLEGPMQVTTRAATEAEAAGAPPAVHVLQVGEMLAVEPKTPHLVTGVDDGPCRFVIIQGVGTYDFIPLEEDR